MLLIFLMNEQHSLAISGAALSLGRNRNDASYRNLVLRQDDLVIGRKGSHEYRKLPGCLLYRNDV